MYINRVPMNECIKIEGYEIGITSGKNMDIAYIFNIRFNLEVEKIFKINITQPEILLNDVKEFPCKYSNGVIEKRSNGLYNNGEK